jgi:hypothetical protein
MSYSGAKGRMTPDSALRRMALSLQPELLAAQAAVARASAGHQ